MKIPKKIKNALEFNYEYWLKYADTGVYDGKMVFASKPYGSGK